MSYPVLYRDHRGHLDESMATVQEVASLADLNEHLNKSFDGFPWKVEAIKFEHLGLDERTGWDTYAVMVKYLPNGHKFYPFGFSNGILK